MWRSARRDFLRLSWMDAARVQAEDLRKRGMACILLFHNGGPSQYETFDPKPGTEAGGPTKTINTVFAGDSIRRGLAADGGPAQRYHADPLDDRQGRQSRPRAVLDAHRLCSQRRREVSQFRLDGRPGAWAIRRSICRTSSTLAAPGRARPAGRSALVICRSPIRRSSSMIPAACRRIPSCPPASMWPASSGDWG